MTYFKTFMPDLYIKVTFLLNSDLLNLSEFEFLIKY